MLKIFTTQLTGIFSRIQDKESEAIEDGARLLAQAVVSGHSIYLYGANELLGILHEASAGREPFPSIKVFPDSIEHITESDRVLMFCSSPGTEEEQALAKELYEKGAGVVCVSPVVKDQNGIEQYCDVHIDTKLKMPLVPDEDGTRFGFPSLMVGLYVYHALSFTLKEILQEYA
ncbi:DUF2529 domain-containing protein [Bacillus atrophaeus]|uniref:DUF2529 domain-containing protein n=1 Tax=Bacillus atrophaeus TaxID=1452 RepID=UPI00227DDCFC|nr:DUF2529 domain-containing protein [Bacillus atrophaeus]MCY8499146.1 DUF2529 domain-containing protein [Bacillus atrophaeus]MCY8811875.1 DUF2529 domain-containing protein [Bacillus atrophaeus]MCY8820808.1 DUF2529 domain-containing protein [Bacillus atrophaeus]MCY8827987.1 DUF2529 domain-containing protein [Bacillus atrophaeus]MCY8832040.1 DUF2529 domain-containing protein [Bacillus atrophaeus]